MECVRICPSCVVPKCGVCLEETKKIWREVVKFREVTATCQSLDKSTLNQSKLPRKSLHKKLDSNSVARSITLQRFGNASSFTTSID